MVDPCLSTDRSISFCFVVENNGTSTALTWSPGQVAKVATAAAVAAEGSRQQAAGGRQQIGRSRQEAVGYLSWLSRLAISVGYLSWLSLLAISVAYIS